MAGRKERPGAGLAALRRDIAAGKIAPVYLLHGPELLLADEAEQLVLDAALPPEARSFNLDVLYGAETTARDVIDRASSFPLGAERRVVIVRDAEKIPDRQLLKSYLEHPAPTTVLILSTTKADFKEHPFLAAKEHAAVVALDPPRESEVPAWIEERVRRRGRRIDPAAVEALASRMRPSLQDIQNEIEKLMAFAGEGATIGEEAVHALVGDTREFNVFALQKALGAGDERRTLQILGKLLRKPGDAISIVAALTRFYGILWRLQDLQRKRSDEGELAAELGVPTYFFGEYAAALRRLPPGGVEQAVDLLTEADEKLKSSGGADEEIMTLALVQILSLQARNGV